MFKIDFEIDEFLKVECNNEVSKLVPNIYLLT